MNILVLAPMEREASNFKKSLSKYKLKHRYKVVCTGVGKANAAAVTALELYGSTILYDLLVVIGYAAASSYFKVGDFVVPSTAMYHDTRVPSGLVPELDSTYQLQGNDDAIILTGDAFVTSDNYRTILRKAPIPRVLFDMEVAAICQVAESTPVLVLKFVSDIPSAKNNLSTFNEFVNTHSDFSQFVQYLEYVVPYEA